MSETNDKKKRKDDPRALEIRKSLYRRLKKIAKEEDLGLGAIAYMIQANTHLSTNINNNEDVSLYTFIRAIHVLGYEISLAKNDVPFNWKEDKILVQRKEKYNTNQRNAQRRHRKQPEGDLPIRIRIKKRNVPGSTVITAVSRKQTEDARRKQDNIFATSRSRNEIPGTDI